MTDVIIIENPPQYVVVENSQPTETVVIGTTSGGLALSDIAYTHTQAVPADVWTIVHSLAFRPNVTVVDSAGSEVEGDVQHLNATTIQVSFSGAFSGAAYLS